MGYTSLDRVVEVIDRLGLTRMIAYDGNGHTLDHAETESAKELVDLVDDLVRNTSGTMRIEAWQAAPPKVPGQRKGDAPKVERCAWHVRGLLGAGAAPAAQDRAETPAPAPKGTDVETAVQMARLAWQVELLQSQLKEQATDDGSTDDGTDDDDDDGKGLFGMTGDQTFQVLGGLKELVAPLLTPLAQRIGGLPPGAAPAPSAPGISAGELQVLEAFRKFRQAQPETADGLLSELMGTYGPNAKPPATDGAEQR